MFSTWKVRRIKVTQERIYITKSMEEKVDQEDVVRLPLEFYELEDIKPLYKNSELVKYTFNVKVKKKYRKDKQIQKRYRKMKLGLDET